MLLGTSATCRIHVHAPRRISELQSQVQVGELTKLSASADDAEFTYAPPAARIPQVALVVFWLANDPRPPDVAVARVSLVGQLDLEVNTDPGALVRVQVAGKTFGPRRADAHGHVRVPIEVPPIAHEARVLGEVHGKAPTSVQIPLDVPRTNPLVAFVSPDPLVAGEPGWLWVIDANAQTGTLELSARGALVQPDRSENDRALYRLQPEPNSPRVALSLGLRGVPEARLQLSTAVVKDALPRPSGVTTQAPELGSRFVPSALVGGFYGGGANVGPVVAVGVGVRLPVLDERLIAELEVGYREAWFNTEVAGLGGLGNTLLALPLTVGGRARLVRSGPWLVDARIGGGVMPAIHMTRSDFQPAYSESGVSGVAFAAIAGGYQVGNFELFAEARGQWSPVSLPHVSAQLGGFGLSLGVRRVSP